MKKTLSTREIIFIGLMIFSLFFGAGNLIFPAELGRAAGTAVWSGMVGFLIAGVGLPLLGLLAIAQVSADGSTEALSEKVHPIFASVLTCVTYLTIGPLFAGPRTGVVSYEIAVAPFLANQPHRWALFAFTLVYFGIVYYLALYPSKFVDHFGKIVTPFLLLILGGLILASIIHPLNGLQEPQFPYTEYPFLRGIKAGYLTMDTIVSIVFATIIITAVKDRGVTEKRVIQTIIFKAGSIAALFLGLIYFGLSYVGASSAQLSFASGAEILAGVSTHYFGIYGNIIFGLAILLACIPTGAGLLSSCALYFHQLLPRFSYQQLLTAFVLFSCAVANIGLNELIRISVPVLSFIYPIIIVLILLTFIDKIVPCHRYVYRGAIAFTMVVSLNDGLMAVQPNWDFISPIIYLPFTELGFGWVLPAIVGGLVGWIYSLIKE